jgi:epoxyqueuosine reductase
MNLGLSTSPAERAGVTLFEPLEPTSAAPPGWRAAIVAAAQSIGFSRTGFATITPFAEAGAHFSEYIAGARHGSMTYLERGPRNDPASLLPEARTLIAVALAYAGGSRLVQLKQQRPLAAEIAAYALGPDYHHVIKAKLAQLGQACANIVGRPVLGRSCVDTAPLLEREAARRAGVGFIGKSTMNIIPGIGSYFLTGELLVDALIEADTPIPDGCGRCRSCLDACPTQAFVDAYTLDARRCIAYLTIEHRGVIPKQLRAAIGARVFGCDVCQDVCPYNAAADKHPASSDLWPRTAPLGLSLPQLLELTAAGYRRLVRGSALARATRRMLQRNAAIALGNSGRAEALAPLLGALGSNSELVRGHAAWALGNLPYANENRTLALESLAQHDPVAWVRDEAEEALASLAKLR